MKRGLTLIELLVAVIVSGIVAIIAFNMISGEQKHFTKTREKVRLQSDAREGMRILEEEIKNAGYRTSAAINAATKVLTAGACSQAVYASGASFDPNPSATIYGGQKGLEIRFYMPSTSTTTLDCAADVWTVGYKYDASSKTLYRQAKKGDPAVAANALSATGWVPFLEGVSAFSTTYGVLQERSLLFVSPASMATAAAADWNCSEGAIANCLDLATSTGDQWSLRNYTNNKVTLVFKNVPLASSGGGPADGARREALNDKATYRFSFNASATENFFDDASGLSSTWGGTPSNLIECGFFDGLNQPISKFTFRPVKGGVVHVVQHDLVPPASATKAYFGLRYQLKGTSATSRNLTISSLDIVRLNKGEYNFVSAVPSDLKTVQALGLQMAVISKNETLRFDRIIPMVNNGL